MTRATLLTYATAPLRLVKLVGYAVGVLCYELYMAAKRRLAQKLAKEKSQ